jgi:hypothetical protein
VIEGFTLTNGQATKGGGILCTIDTAPTITKNTITGNMANWGGGIYCDVAAPILMSNFITENTAISGGGITCWISDAEITNNFILGNSASAGAGIFCEMCSPVIINNTIYENSASQHGGGIWCIGCFSDITNTILWGNTAPQGAQIDLDGYSDPVVTYCDVQGGWPGQGNIDADPVFVESAIGDYHLTYTSPCREGGDYDAPNLPWTDFEGDLRDPCGIPDIGADEFWTHLYAMGDIVPGGQCSARLIATPDFSGWLVLGSGLIDPPYPTQYGDLYILPPFRSFELGTVPPSGALIFPATVPAGWSTGESYYFQAMVQWMPPLNYLYLSNLMVVTVQ